MMHINGKNIYVTITVNSTNGNENNNPYEHGLRQSLTMHSHRLNRTEVNPTPLLDGVVAGLRVHLPNRQKAWSATIKIEGFPFSMEKNGSRFKLMGKPTNKKFALQALAKTCIYAATSNKKGGNLFLFLTKFLETPVPIKRALDERIPFTFYDYETVTRGAKAFDPKLRRYVTTRITSKRVKETHHVLLNLEKIGDELYAIEISDNIWGKIRERELLKLILIGHGKTNTRSKWWMITPKELWAELIGSQPTKSELKTMTQFLKHNRKSKMVEDASIKLVKSLMDNPNCKVRLYQGTISVLVRGEVGDWLIGGTQMGRVTGALQDARTVLLKSINDAEEGDWSIFDLVTGNSCCIDNLYAGSSVGDQIFTRVMGCLNDNNRSSIMYNRATVGFRIPNFDKIEHDWND